MRERPATRLLLVEDNHGDARLLHEMLAESSSLQTKVTHVHSMREAEKSLSNGGTDIILLDLGLPDAQGLGAVRPTHAAAPRIPLVVLTGLDDETLADQALQEGAEDYLIKGQIEPRGLHEPAVCDRTQGNAGGAVRGEGTGRGRSFDGWSWILIGGPLPTSLLLC